MNIGSSDESVIDLSGDDGKPGGGVYPVKQESVIIEEAPDDAMSLVYRSDSPNSDDEDNDSSPTGRGHRVRV